MSMFLTTYQVNGVSYGAEFPARSRRAARRLIQKRGLGERIEGEGRQRTRLGTAAERYDAIHEAVWLGWIGLRSGTVTADELLSDHGLIHRHVHALAGIDDSVQHWAEGDSWAMPRLRDQHREVLSRVPGAVVQASMPRVVPYEVKALSDELDQARRRIAELEELLIKAASDRIR